MVDGFEGCELDWVIGELQPVCLTAGLMLLKHGCCIWDKQHSIISLFDHHGYSGLERPEVLSEITTPLINRAMCREHEDYQDSQFALRSQIPN